MVGDDEGEEAYEGEARDGDARGELFGYRTAQYLFDDHKEESAAIEPRYWQHINYREIERDERDDKDRLDEAVRDRGGADVHDAYGAGDISERAAAMEEPGEQATEPGNRSARHTPQEHCALHKRER